MSIAEKNTIISANNVTIAENEQKVYKAGQLKTLQDSEYMNTKVSGTAIAVNDVSPIEHSVGCKLRSKNLFDSSLLLASDKWNLVDGYYTGIPSYLYQIYRSDTGLSLFNNFKPNTQYTFSFTGYSDDENTQGAKLFTFRFKYSDGTTEDIWIENNIEKTYTLTTSAGKTIVGLHIYYGRNPVSYVKNIQLELGTTATAYTPYISDFTGIEVSRYGKNLLPSDISNLDNWVDAELSGNQAGSRFYFLNLAEGYKHTISLKIKDGIPSDMGYLYLFRSNDNWQTEEQVIMLIQNKYNRTPHTFTAEKGYKYALWWFSVYARDRFEKYYYDLQIEVGETKTEYEPYIEPTTYTAKADGIVEGILSLSPNITLLTNNNDVVINANYLRDIDTYIDNLITDVALSGGEA